MKQYETESAYLEKNPQEAWKTSQKFTREKAHTLDISHTLKPPPLFVLLHGWPSNPGSQLSPEGK
jgi:hypothetical protein